MPITTDTACDASLRQRFRAGEAEAVREVCARYTRPLLAFSRTLLADPTQADDVVQQTFLQAWRSASSYDPARPLSPWLFQICRRSCIDSHRRRRATALLEDHERHPALSVDGPSIERTWTVAEVRRAIDDLPADVRDVIRLTHLDGWTLEQAARHLGVPVGTVKSRSFRAHKRLLVTLGHLRDDGRRPVLVSA